MCIRLACFLPPCWPCSIPRSSILRYFMLCGALCTSTGVSHTFIFKQRCFPRFSCVLGVLCGDEHCLVLYPSPLSHSGIRVSFDSPVFLASSSARTSTSVFSLFLSPQNVLCCCVQARRCRRIC